MSTRASLVLRIARVSAGVVLLAIGAALLVLPEPGIPVVLGALVLLETEFHWARTLRVRVTGYAKRCSATALASVRTSLGRSLVRATKEAALPSPSWTWIDSRT